MVNKKWSVGFCKRYWKYYTIEAETEAMAKSIAFAQAERDKPPSDVDGWSAYNNEIELSDCTED